MFSQEYKEAQRMLNKVYSELMNNFELNKAKDELIYGVHITKDGERVDPTDFYLAPKEEK